MKVLSIFFTVCIVCALGIPAPEGSGLSQILGDENDEVLFSLDGFAIDEESDEGRQDYDGDDDEEEPEAKKDNTAEVDGDEEPEAKLDNTAEVDGDEEPEAKLDNTEEVDGDEESDRKRHHSHSHSHSHERHGSCAIALGGSTNCFSNITSCRDSVYLQAQIVAGQRVASSCCSGCSVPSPRPINVRIGVKYCKRIGCCFTVPSGVTGSCDTLAANQTLIVANRCFDQTNLLTIVAGNVAQVNVCRRASHSSEFSTYFNVTAPLWPRVFCSGHHC